VKKILFTLGCVVFLSPFCLTVLGAMICIIHPTNICAAAPFAWMLLWPAYITGIILIAVSALISSTIKTKLFISTFLILLSACAAFVSSQSSRIQVERADVIKFVKENEKVILAAGQIAGIYPETEKLSKFSVPIRYILSVNGKRNFSAVVDVSRSWGQSTFTLVCITHIPQNARSPFEDCPQ
jgi:hypothetical protein